MNMNLAVLVGRLTKDIELQTTKNKTSVASFTLAINEGYGDRKNTEFIDCVAWKGIAEFLNKYAKKGDIISVEGRLANNFYEGSDGKSIKKTEVVARIAQLVKNKDKDVESEVEETTTTTDIVSEEERPF